MRLQHQTNVGAVLLCGIANIFTLGILDLFMVMMQSFVSRLLGISSAKKLIFWRRSAQGAQAAHCCFLVTKYRTHIFQGQQAIRK
jgi:uncharacterized membrane protein